LDARIDGKGLAMIRIGMLWLDDNTRSSFSAKLQQAMSYYEGKYGQPPNVCYVHPSCLPEDVSNIPIPVRTAKDILPHHFLFGVGEATA
jgi:hypothetical protein